MIRTTLAITLLAAFAFAQTPTEQRFYARAYYTKWKPGKAAEGQAYMKDVVAKGSQAWVQKEPKAVGQITMTRVLPGGDEITHDRLRITVYSAPPNLDGSDTPGAFAEKNGLAPADYSAKLRSFFDTTRTEIWSSVLRHGSIRQGDYVRVVWTKIPGGGRDVQDRVKYYQTWPGPMYQEVMKSGLTRGHENWQVRNATEEEPSWISITVFPDSDSTFKSFPDQQATFLKAHPGKDYHAYREAGAALAKAGVTTQSITYRVDLAQWK